MPIATDAASILPDDWANAALMGRIWRPDLAGPSVVAIRQDGVFDITGDFPTASQLAGETGQFGGPDRPAARGASVRLRPSAGSG